MYYKDWEIKYYEEYVCMSDLRDHIRKHNYKLESQYHGDKDQWMIVGEAKRPDLFGISVLPALFCMVGQNFRLATSNMFALPVPFFCGLLRARTFTLKFIFLGLKGANPDAIHRPHLHFFVGRTKILSIHS